MAASSAPLAAPRSPRYQALDFWRGVACLLVIVYHSTYYVPLNDLHGVWAAIMPVVQLFWQGVPIFFVISGYCIAAAVDSSRRRSNQCSYFVRRFRRIYPPFWIFVATSVALVLVVEAWIQPRFFEDLHHPIYAPTALSVWQWLCNLTLTESWRASVAGPPTRFFMGHAWTLCYEEQFYFVMGVLLLLFPRRLFFAAALVTGLCVAARHLLPKYGVTVDGFFFDGHWPMFAAGILVYYQVNYGRRERLWMAITALLLGLGYSLRRAPVLNDGYVTDTSGIFAFSFALLLLFLHRYDDKLSTAKPARPIAWCGTMCYSLYLVHWPIVKIISKGFFLVGANGPAFTFLITVPLCVATAIACARQFHIHVERKFLNQPSRREAAGESASTRAGSTSPTSTSATSTSVTGARAELPLAEWSG